MLARLFAFLTHRRLPLWLGLIATALLLPTLALGFHLDDYVHRYLLSDLPGAAELRTAYQSPFGIANGDPAINHWQIEAGYAPFWIHPQLLISLLRPVSELSHQLDALLWPSSALLQHAHSLAWYFALVVAAAWLYRSMLGTTAVAGIAALLYALDHTHGFAIGWIANRNALIAACLGVLALLGHQRGREHGSRAWLWASPPLFLCALLAGEGAIAIFGYLLAYALFLDPGRPRQRWLALAPHVLAIAVWRIAYQVSGRGARFSGLYIDPVHEPLRFAVAAVERIPVLLLGELWLPAAEAYVFTGYGLAIWLLAVFAGAYLLYAALPLLRADPRARFFGVGMAAALVPACTTYPHNRLLFFVGIGALALVSQLWYGLLQRAAWLRPSALWRRSAQGFAAFVLGFHLLCSPLFLPFAAWGIALTSGTEPAVRSALAGAAGRELVIVSSPDYYYVKLLPVLSALEQRPGPRRLRALSFGAVPLQVTRLGARELELRYHGGLLASPLLELYRARQLPMAVGSRIELRGLRIEVTDQTSDLRIAAARFRFDAPLEDPRYRFLAWERDRYRPFVPPAVGSSVKLAPASLPYFARYAVSAQNPGLGGR